MAVTLKSDFVQEQKQWVKRAMKGRPLYFGLQAQAAKKGKFLVSKKPGEVKPDKVRKLELYEGSGKDKTKAEQKNTIPGGASMGVAQGENGTLKLYFERGKALPVAEKFVKHFVTREMKFKLVKKVQIAETDQLPSVPEKDDRDDQQVTAQSVEARVKELAGRSKAAGGDAYGLPDRLKQVLGLAKTNAGQADDALDEIEFVIGTLERAKELQEDLKSIAGQPGVAKEPVAAIVKKIAEALKQVKAEDADGADDALDVAEQSIANLRKAAGLPEPGAPEPADMSKVDDEKAAAFFKDWLEGIKPDLKTLKDAKAGELKEIGEHVKGVSEAAGKKDWKAAADAYKMADALITAAMKGVHLASDRPAVSVVAFQRSRLVWADAKRKMKSELEKLRESIVKQSEGDEDAADIAAAANELVAEFDQFDSRLEEILEQITVAPEGAGRDDLKRAANGVISTYAAILETPFFAAVDNNPFTTVDVTGQARRSLSMIQKTLV